MLKTNYKGSEATKQLVAAQIAEKFGEEEVKRYKPEENCMTFQAWLKNGYRVKRGEKCLKSITIISVVDEAGNIVRKYKRGISLFYIKQVEKITA